MSVATFPVAIFADEMFAVIKLAEIEFVCVP